MRTARLLLKQASCLLACALLLGACARPPAAPAVHGMCYVHLQRLKRAAATDPAALQALFNHYGGAGHDPARQQAVLAKARAAGHPWARAIRTPDQKAAPIAK